MKYLSYSEVVLLDRRVKICTSVFVNIIIAFKFIKENALNTFFALQETFYFAV